MTHCFGWSEGLESLVRFAENIWEEIVFEVLLGLDFFCQPNAGLGAIKQRHSEKAATIVIASSKFYGHRWFISYAVAVLVQFSVFNGMTPNLYEKNCLLTLVTGVPQRIESNQVRRTYFRKTYVWAK